MTDDPGDLLLASKGLAPRLTPFRDHLDVHSSILMSLARLYEGGDTIHRIVSLQPGTGMIGDLRACIVSPEFYFRSDMNCDTMLRSLLTEGEYEAF